MARDPHMIPEPDFVTDVDHETAGDPDLEPYDETIENPNSSIENYIPPEEL